jgi:hypothetical protein
LLSCLEQCATYTLDALLKNVVQHVRAWRSVPSFADDLSLLAIEIG